MDEELLYNQMYEKTADCGRTQFVKLLMDKERENQQLKEQLEKEKEVKSKAIGHVNACGGELTKDECKYLLQILDIDKGE